MNAPNIVLIMADQLTPFATGAYGHPLAETPAMTALAARGVRFDSAYTNAPLCAPARFAFMSGQHVTRIAAYDNASEFSSTVPTFAHALRELGYRTCLSGKMHFIGPDQLHGFAERLTTDIYPADFAWTPDWELPDERIDKWYHNMDSVREAGVAATTFQLEYDEEVGFLAERRLFGFAREAAAQPFLMVVSFIHPHDPYVAQQRWWDRIDHEAVTPPTVPPLPLERHDAHSRRLLAGIDALDAEIGEEQVRTARHAYFANVAYVDHWIGRLVATLEAAGLAEDTLVIVTSDHGDMLGERGLWYKMNFFEWSGRVPLIMAGPGLPEGRTVSNNVSLVDIMPTLIEAASSGRATESPNGRGEGGGEEARTRSDAVDAMLAGIDGRSLWGLATGALDPADDPDEAIGEYCAECASHPIFMIRRGRHKYVHCDVDPPLLFDLVDDPDELRNLANDPACREIADGFAAEVRRRWDGDTVRRDVIATQRQRRAVHAAMQDGTLTSWDYQPRRDAANEYVRNHMDWTVTAARSRFPPHGGGDRS